MLTFIQAAALLLVPGAVPQSAPDLFACTDPSRLSTGTLSYEFELLERPTTGTVILERLRDGSEDVVRIRYRPLGTIEVVTDLDPITLAPIRGRLHAGGKQTARYDRVGNQIRAFKAGDAPEYTVEAGSGPVVFGGANLLPFLAATVDWERCKSVTARQFVAEPRSIELLTFKRAASTSLNYQGLPVDVWEIAIGRSSGDVQRVWVTRSRTPVALQFTTGAGGRPWRFISRRLP